MNFPEFAVHKLNERGMKEAEAIRMTFDVCLTTLNQICGPGRELSIVKTKLEEACFFAKKSMASKPENQQTV